MRASPSPESHAAPDAALLAAIAAGDEPAFVTLVERYESRFYRVARRMLGDDREAEDAVQTALLQIYRSASAYRERWSGSTWLYRVLTNVCVDLWRKRRRLAPDEGEAARLETSARGPGSIAAIDVDRALARLPAEARAILLLCYVEQMPYAEIARVRGITINTVKTQLSRAKRHMRKHLSEVIS